MSALTDLSDVINRLTGGNSGAPENIFWYKDAVAAGSTAVTVAGRFSSLWQYSGIPSGANAPGAVAAPDNTTTGGLKQTDPAGGAQKFLLGATAHASQPGTLILYDRLLHISGLDGTSVAAQTVGGTLTRYTSGSTCVGNQIWIEIYTLIGATSRTITASYTNQAGTAGQITQAANIGNTGLREVQRVIPLTLASGDTGVEAVASVTLSASTGTVGDFGVTVAHPLLYIPIGATGTGNVRDLISGLPAIQQIFTDACLAWCWLAQGTTAPVIFGSTHFIEKA